MAFKCIYGGECNDCGKCIDVDDEDLEEDFYWPEDFEDDQDYDYN